MKIETKFNRGDTVWVMRHNKPTKMTVSTITVHINYYGASIVYNVKKIGFWGQSENVGENLLAFTKEELLKQL